MIRTTIRRDALTLAIRTSGFLSNWFELPDLATCEQVEPAFTVLTEVIESLPPTLVDSGTLCYLRNHIGSSHRLYKAGEWGAAAHQLRHIHRKLARFRRSGITTA